MRSRALTNADRSVRIVLNVGSDFEHVAYATDDALAAARALRESGTELLEIPENYYDDLAARTTIDVEPLRELGVLYDRDDGGEFLHFYTHAPRSPLLRGGRAPRRLRRLRGGQLARSHGGATRAPQGERGLIHA